MKISEQEVSRLLSYSLTDQQSLRNPSPVMDAAHAVVRTADATHVSVSSTAQDVRRIAQLIKQLPDVREDRVQELKAQIENGTYHVSSEDIADLMIRRAIADNSGR